MKAGYPSSIGPRCRWWIAGALALSYSSFLYAAVSMDGTLGRAGPLPGPDYAITPDLGRQLGGNLFYSFGQFSIYAGESATFSGPDSVQNIIGRVTGGEVSFIDGMVRSTIPGANLYLLNPAGVLFGEHAQLDVPGSVHVSTAAELRLSDGAAFSAASPGISTLSVAPPEAFGFLGPNQGEIRIEGSRLTFTPGSQVTLNAGAITIQDSLLLVEGGDLVLTAMGDATGAVPVNGVFAGEARGRLTIENAQWDEDNPLGLRVSGDGGGGVWLRGGETRLRNAAIIANNWGTRDASRGVDLEVGSLTLENSLISSDALDIGHGGNVSLGVREDLRLLNGGIVSASTFGAGAAGDITITARNLLVAGGNHLESLITSRAYEGSSGRGGTIHVTVAETLALQPNGFISASTFGLGDAGDITIRAGTLRIDNQNQDPEKFFAGIAAWASSDATGEIGHITIHADTLRLLNGGQISASSNATRPPRLAAGREERTPNIQITARDLELSNGSSITSEASGNTPAGDISLEIGERLTLDRSRITTEAYDGDGGAITLNGGTVFLHDSQITTSVFGPRGDGGDITLTPDALVLDGGFIQANTAATNAKGGDIRIATPVLLTPADQELRIGGQTEETFQPGVNVIQAAAPDGVSGAVQVTPPTLNLSSNLVELNTPYLDAAAQLSPRCGTGDPRQRSRFTVQGRGALPPEPDEPITVPAGGCGTASPAPPPPVAKGPEPLTTASFGFGDR